MIISRSIHVAVNGIILLYFIAESYSIVYMYHIFSLTPYAKINSKCIKDLNVRLDTIKLLEENIDRTLSDINRSNIFLDIPPRVMKIQTKINIWDPVKFKSFCTAKETITKQKDSPQNGRKYLQTVRPIRD